MTNDQMKSGRFAKMAQGRKLYRRMCECWNRGGDVWICTYLRRTQVTAKNRDAIRLVPNGELYVRRGKHWDYISGCAIGFTA